VLKTFIIAAGATTMALGTAGSAQQAAAGNAPKPVTRADFVRGLDTRFAAMDTNKDGVLSKAEIQAAQSQALQTVGKMRDERVRAEFNQLDTNKDGQLSYAEFSAGAPTVKAGETADQLAAQLDANKDGKVSADEFKNPQLAKFNALDANKDGTVSVDEMRKAATKR
jgi:Ca2+-binding EF-hand superfamily protein